MSIRLCKKCGQRAGIYLPHRKAAIFDYVLTHPGCSIADITAHCFSLSADDNLVRSHVHQLNVLLKPLGIMVSGKLPRGEYRVISRPAGRADRVLPAGAVNGREAKLRSSRPTCTEV